MRKSNFKTFAASFIWMDLSTKIYNYIHCGNEFKKGPLSIDSWDPKHKWLTEFRLRIVSSPNCAIYHDRRFGLLHFLPSDPTQPEITLTLSAATRNALWFSNGEACGNPDFIIPGNRIISDEEGYQRLIRLLEEK